LFASVHQVSSRRKGLGRRLGREGLPWLGFGWNSDKGPRMRELDRGGTRIREPSRVDLG
jgi:hypothetical protein